MQIPVQITFRDIPPSPAVEAAIREKAAKLDRYYDRITSCRVMVEAPSRHHHKGGHFHIRIDLTVPGGEELVVSRDPAEHADHSDVYVAVRDAFAAAERQIHDLATRRHANHA